MATPKQKTPAGIPYPAVDPQLVDELGEINRRLAPFRIDISREESLKKAIRTAFDAAPAEASVEASGTRFAVILGPRGNQTSIDFPALVKKLGAKVFAGFARCTLTDLKDKVSADIAAQVTSTAATGARTLQVFAKVKQA